MLPNTTQLPVHDSVNKSTSLSPNTCSKASTVPLQNNLFTSSWSSNTAVQSARYSLVQIWSRDHHLNLCLKQYCLYKDDSPQKDVEGDTSLLTTPSDNLLQHDQNLLSVIFSYLFFPKRSKLLCVNKDWQRSSTNHRSVTINSKTFGMNMDNFFLSLLGKSLIFLRR